MTHRQMPAYVRAEDSQRLRDVLRQARKRCTAITRDGRDARCPCLRCQAGTVTFRELPEGRVSIACDNPTCGNRALLIDAFDLHDYAAHIQLDVSAVGQNHFDDTSARNVADYSPDLPNPNGVVDDLIDWGDMSPWPTLHEDALYGLAGDVVRLIEPETEADPVALLFTFLTLFGNYIGPRCYGRVNADHHPPRLFTLLCGETVGGKRQSLSDISPIFKLADAEWWKHARIYGIGSGEGLLDRLADSSEDNPARAVLIEEEYAGLLTATGREGSIASQMLRKIWDGGVLESLISGKKKRLPVYGAHVSVLAHITPEELRARLKTVEIADGFANRFLPACVRSSKSLPEGGFVSEAVYDQLASRIIDIQHHLTIGGVIGRTLAAKEQWADIYNRLPHEPGLLGKLTARAKPHMLRLQVAYALLDDMATIDGPHVRAAHAAWNYCVDSARYVFGETFGDFVEDNLLYGIRQAYPEAVSYSDQLDFFSKHVGAARIAQARLALEQRRRIRSFPLERTGPGRTTWVSVAIKTEKGN